MKTAQQARAECLRVLADFDGSRLVVDLSDVTFLDSSGIQMLLDVRRTAEERHVEVVLLGVRRNVVRTFAILGLQDVLPVIDEL